jgi:UrcA family protein
MNFRTILASLAITCIAAPVIAAPQDQVSIQISVDDLDLSTARDQKILKNRLNSAAQKICRSGFKGTTARVAEQRCVKAALESALP